MKRENVTYDIVVVGAGPAGANFARLCDSEKYKVLLIDGSEGREKVCGGLISPDTQDILARYGLSLPSEVLASPQLFSVKTIDLSDGAIKYYRRNYINANREELDRFFLSLVPDSVETVQGRCISIERMQDGFSVTLRENGAERQILCRYIVGADGAPSIVRRELFGAKRIYRYVAIQQWFEAGEVNPFYSCVFDNKTSSGCSWVFFKDGKMIFGGAFDPKGSRHAFEKQKKRLEELAVVPAGSFDRPLRTEACQVCRPKLSQGVFLGYNGAFLLGEAAGLISPSSFEGISYALLSSEYLADAFNEPKNHQKSDKIKRKYVKKTAKLRVKIAIKCLKRPFMYNQSLRRAVMRSGLSTIKVTQP